MYAIRSYYDFLRRPFGKVRCLTRSDAIFALVGPAPLHPFRGDAPGLFRQLTQIQLPDGESLYASIAQYSDIEFPAFDIPFN